MTTENNTESTNQSVDAGNTGVATLEAALEKIKTLESNFQEAVSTRDRAKEKLRKLEQDFGQASELQSKYDELFAEKGSLITKLETITSEFNGFKDSIKQEKISGTLQSAIEKAGALSVNTVMKLIDKSKVEFDDTGNVKDESITSLITSLKESDPVLFGEQFIDPGVKRASDASTEGAYEREIKSCRTQREIDAVLRKYGKL